MSGHNERLTVMRAAMISNSGCMKNLKTSDIMITELSETYFHVLIIQVAEEGEDSGTESDDETETEPLEGDSEGCSKR